MVGDADAIIRIRASIVSRETIDRYWIRIVRSFLMFGIRSLEPVSGRIPRILSLATVSFSG